MLAAVGGYVYGVRYVASLSERTSALKKDVEVIDIKYSHILSLEKAAKETGDETLRVNKILIPANGAIDFVSRIEASASQKGLTYNTDSIEARSVPDLESHGKELLVVSFTASGRWSSVVRLIKSIENMPHAIKFEKLDLIMLGESQPAAGASSTAAAIDRSWKASIIFTAIKVKDN